MLELILSAATASLMLSSAAYAGMPPASSGTDQASGRRRSGQLAEARRRRLARPRTDNNKPQGTAPRPGHCSGQNAL